MTGIRVLVVDDEPLIADAHRAFGQEDQPRHEIVDDRLQAETDADAQGAGDEGDEEGDDDARDDGVAFHGGHGGISSKAG